MKCRAIESNRIKSNQNQIKKSTNKSNQIRPQCRICVGMAECHYKCPVSTEIRHWEVPATGRVHRTCSFFHFSKTALTYFGVGPLKTKFGDT